MMSRFDNNHARRKADAGFTIMEVLIGTALFAVAVMGVGTLSHSTSLATGCSQAFAEATYEASRQLEMLVSNKYNSQTGDGAGVDEALHDKVWISNTAGDEGQFTVLYRIFDDAMVRETKSIQMNVDYYCGGKSATNTRKAGAPLSPGKNRRVQIIYLLPLRK